MLEVLREGKCQVLRFPCSVCGGIFLASIDECSTGSVMGITYYEHMCPTCNKWVVGKDTGLTADQTAEIEKLRKDILKEIQLEESLPEDVEV